MSGKKKKMGVERDLSQIDGLPALLEVAKYIGDAKEVVGRTLPQFQCTVDSGARLIGQGLVTIGDIVEIVEFLEKRRDKFPGLFPAPSARAKLAPHPWGDAQHPPTAKHTKHRQSKKGNGKLTIADKDAIRLNAMSTENQDPLAFFPGEDLEWAQKKFGISEREIRQLMRRANGAFAMDFASRIVANTAKDKRKELAKFLVYHRPQLGDWRDVLKTAAART